MCCPLAVRPSLPSEAEAAAEEEMASGIENDETGIIGIDDEYDQGHPAGAMEKGNGSDDLVCADDKC